MKLRLASALLLLAVSPAVAGGDLPDGTYACTLDGQPFGAVKVDGETYSGPVADNAFGAGETFIVLDGKIEFLGSLPLLEAGGYRIDHAPIRPGASGQTGFDLVMLTPDESGFVTAACDIA